jgi:hypothetical protein
VSAKHDVQRGLTADVAADPESVEAACRGAAANFKSASVERSANKVSVTIRQQTVGQVLVGSTKGRHVVVGVSFKQNGDRMHLETALEHWTTSQSGIAVLPFVRIPTGPKEIWGKAAIFGFYDRLENELRALDPQAHVVRREPQR